MNKKKDVSPSSAIKAPRMVSVRDFVRGGYQHVEEPVLVMSQSRAMFAAYPVETSSAYLGAQPPAPTPAGRRDPAWLTHGVTRPQGDLRMTSTIIRNPRPRVARPRGDLRPPTAPDTSPAALTSKLLALGLPDVVVSVGLLPDCPTCLEAGDLCPEHTDFRASSGP